MEEAKNFLKNLLANTSTKNKIFKRNLLKEYFQILVLDFIYSHKDYSQLVFYGGSCLAHCYGLPRLSEDLDFIDLNNKINIENLAKDLEIYFQKNTDITVKAICQKFRINLKFPILKELELATIGESDHLILKVEIFSHFDFCNKFEIETIPLFKFNKTILIRTLDQPTLMSTKIRAIFLRKWEKTNKEGEILASVKGRDYFDLMWFLQKGIRPNIKCIEDIKDIKDLKIKLLEAIKKADSESIQYDLEPLIDDGKIVKDLGANLKKILENGINRITE